MKYYWLPIIPIRWKTQSNGNKVLQQAWAKHYKGNQLSEYEWRDVPVDPDDKTHWTQDVE